MATPGTWRSFLCCAGTGIAESDPTRRESVAPLSWSMADSRHAEKCLGSQILGIEYCEVHRPTGPIHTFSEGRSRMASVFARLAAIATSLWIVSQNRAGRCIEPWPVGNHAISPFSPSSQPTGSYPVLLWSAEPPPRAKKTLPTQSRMLGIFSSPKRACQRSPTFTN
jgi:hypothetical protein